MLTTLWAATVATALATPPPPRLAAAGTLPSAASLHRRIELEFGGRAAARVEVCVAPAGTVIALTLRASSGLAAFDDAVRADVPRWRFAPFGGDAPRCRELTVALVV